MAKDSDDVKMPVLGVSARTVCGTDLGEEEEEKAGPKLRGLVLSIQVPAITVATRVLRIFFGARGVATLSRQQTCRQSESPGHQKVDLMLFFTVFNGLRFFSTTAKRDRLW